MIAQPEFLISTAHVGTWCFVIAVSVLSNGEILMSKAIAKPIGLCIFLIGMSFLYWGMAHLKGAFLGNVKPFSTDLVQSGPYKYIRHPIYLSMLVSTIGLAFGLRSIWGIICTVVLFGSASILRARAEEKELAILHGNAWRDYVNDSFFLIPFLW
jgi:protein-S-isoprenylcysteine O-methyltransferase Ste14